MCNSKQYKDYGLDAFKDAKGNEIPCVVCQQRITQQYIKTAIINSLKESEAIPRLCSEKCCEVWLEIRGVQ